jgi:hypothetical protein
MSMTPAELARDGGNSEREEWRLFKCTAGDLDRLTYWCSGRRDYVLAQWESARCVGKPAVWLLQRVVVTEAADSPAVPVEGQL